MANLNGTVLLAIGAHTTEFVIANQKSNVIFINDFIIFFIYFSAPEVK